MGNKGGKAATDGGPIPTSSPNQNGIRKRPSRSPSLSNKSADVKFAIRGARGVGKTTLVDRLVGRHFTAAYTPSIETTMLFHDLTFKLADEMTVAIYDCNDDFDIETQKSWYDICNIIAFVIDPRSKMSLEYVRAELPKVAKHLKANGGTAKDVLIMINFKDLVYVFVFLFFIFYFKFLVSASFLNDDWLCFFIFN